MATRVSPFSQVVANSPPGTPGNAGSASQVLTPGSSGGVRGTLGLPPASRGSTESDSGSGSRPNSGGRGASTVSGSLTSQYDADPLSHFSKRQSAKGGRDTITDHDNEKLPVGQHRRALRKNVSTKMLRTLVGIRRREPLVTTCSRKIVENKWFVAFTTLLTVYALLGDDCRLLVTNSPADNYFNALTLTCLAIFTFEIVLSCLGKSDYFLGFFFCLDVVSTVTLLLDLTWISDVVIGDGEAVDKLRSGRTARVGAKAGRVVRVIRLVRILKLYKAVHDARQERQRPSENPEVDDWGEDDDKEKKMRAMRDQQHIRESRVGKKLSEMTTRRVIILVLTMLLVLPFLQTDSSSQPPLGAFYGADEVFERWMEMNSTQPTIVAARERYEKAVLKYLYYHNWFTGNWGNWNTKKDVSSPRGFASHVFWWGVMSSKSDVLPRFTWEEMKIRPETITSFAEEVDRQNDIYVYGRMPQSVKQNIMPAEWRGNCNRASRDIWRRGLSVLQDSFEDGGYSVDYAVPCPEDLRTFEKMKYYPRVQTGDPDWHFAFYFDLRPHTRQEAGFSLMITTFICFVLCVASLYFSNDANRLVLRPVENMIKRVEIIRNDPLVAMQMADEEFKTEEKAKAKALGNKKMQMKNKCNEVFNCGKDKSREAPMETLILEKTIIKLGSLLALGFGEAGANIIGHNLESSDSAGVNAMIPGVRVDAIIGFARIRDFSTATEVLKAKVMTFVNQIAEIVHGVVSEFHGAANKNNGDTFLLIWRISEMSEEKVMRMADMSLIAFAKILGAVHRSPLLASYRGHPALQQRLGANCRVCLTFGLHAGWAIEGAVGSEFKIDASYLSPNVSIAVQVENATNTYNVPMLITQSVMDMCCASISTKCRKIDQVVIRGSTTPMCLYCLDLDNMCLRVDDDKLGRPLVWNSRWRFKARQFLEAEKCRKLDSEVATVTMFEQCKDITLMRRRYSIEFLQLFNMGYQNYSEGEWQVARRLLSDTRTMLRVEDGPSAALLKFMENPFRYQAPSDWKGHHFLVVSSQ